MNNWTYYYLEFALTGQYEQGLYYAPLTRWLFMLFALAGPMGDLLFTILLIGCAGLSCYYAYKGFGLTGTIYVGFIEFLFIGQLNIDPLCAVLLFYCYANLRKKRSFLIGLLSGLALFKPNAVFVVLYLLLMVPPNKRAEYLTGVLGGITIMWGEFAWNWVLLDSFLKGLLSDITLARSNPVLDWFLIIGYATFFHAWAGCGHYSFYKFVRQRQKIKRKFMVLRLLAAS